MKDKNYINNELLRTDTNDPAVNLQNSLENLKFQTRLVENYMKSLNLSTKRLKESMESLKEIIK